MGTSLGANTALEAASLAPERLRGMVIEMPVLDNALLGCARGLHAADARADVRRARDAGAGARRARWCRAGGCRGRRTSCSTGCAQDPEPSAAVIQGLFFGRTAPHRDGAPHVRDAGAGDRPPARHRPPVLRRRDAGRRAARTARLLQASSILELRLAPERLTGEIAAFLDECWKPRPPSGRRGAERRARLADLREAAHGGHQLVELLRRPRRRRPATASATQCAHVAVQHVDGDLLERGLHGGDLREDVDAVGVLVDHPLQPAHLALDPAEAVVDGARVGVHGRA